MADFTLLDWFWTGAFLLLMVGGAFFFYRLARRSESDFFLAGRGMGWFPIGLSIVAVARKEPSS